MIPHPGLRTRIFLTLLGMMILAVLLVAVFARSGTANEFDRFLARDFARDQLLVAQLLEDRLRQNDLAGAQRLTETVERTYRVPVLLVDLNGRVVAASRRADVGRRMELEGGENGRFPPNAPLLYQLTADNRVEFTPPEIPAGAFRSPGRGRQPSFPSTSNDNQQTFIGSINRFFLVIAFAAVIIAGIGGLLLARRILQPVEALTQAAHSMAAGDLSQRVQVASQDELGELSQAFNQMASGLQQQEQLRRNMVSDIAHELRTPLSNIRGYLEAVQDSVLEPDEATVNLLHEEALLLNHLVEDLQELSLAEAGQLRLDLRECDVASLARQAVQSVQLAAAEKQIKLGLDLADNLPEVWADGERVLQILRNLLQNGVSYTPVGGEVTLTAVSTPTTVNIAIHDSGDGIAAEHLPHLFDRFYRADKSRNRATGGTGLGLAISKALLDMQNGRIWVESSPSQGSTFTISLPQTAATPRAT